MSLLKALLIGSNLISRSIQQTTDIPLDIDSLLTTEASLQPILDDDIIDTTVVIDADLDSVVDTPPLWIKVLSCTEGTGSLDTESRFTFNYDDATMRQLASTANTIKIEPVNGELNPDHDNFAVMARPDSDAVRKLNQFSEVTSAMDTNWVGSDSAKGRLSQTATGSDERSFTDYIYEGTDTESGIRIAPATNDCQWDGSNTFGQDIDVFFGYYTQIVVTGCYGWDYASVSNSLNIQLKGSNGQSRFFNVNEYSSLPVHGRTAGFWIGVDLATVGSLYSVVLSVDDPHGYCIKELTVNLANGRSYTFDEYGYFGTGIVLSDCCQYSYKSVLPQAPLIRCIDDYFELYTDTMRGIYHVNMHTCVDKDAGMCALNMEDALYTTLMGKTKELMSYSTTEFTYLDHYQVGIVHLDKVGHVIASNVFIYEDMMQNEAWYARDEAAEGTIIGIKIEAVGRYHLHEDLGSHLRVKMDGKAVNFKSYMVLDDGQYLVMFLSQSDRITNADPMKSVEIRIYGADVKSSGHHAYVNVFVILEGHAEQYQLPWMIEYDEMGLDWFDANERCKAEYGTQLSSVHSKDESFLLEGFIGEAKAWIGLVDFDLNGLMPYDRDYNGDWKWIDGSYLQFTNWISGDVRTIHNHDDGRDCSFADGHRDGWDTEDCHTDKIYSYTCSSPYWYRDNHRKFEVNVDCDVHNCINDVVLISIGNNDDEDALCLDSVSVDDRVSIDISTNWIGGSYAESSMNVIFKYPVCKTQLVDIFVDYNTSVSAVKTPAFQLPGPECYNGNRIIESQCCIEQDYGLPKKTLFGVNRRGGNYKYSWASASDVTLSTTQSTSYSTTNDFQFLSTYSFQYVDEDGAIVNLKPHSIFPNTPWHDTQMFNRGVPLGYAGFATDDDPRYGTLFENIAPTVMKCQAELMAPPSHSVKYSNQFNGLSYKVDVFADLKLTLCHDFINQIDENDETQFAYIRNVPAQVMHFEPITCNVKFDGIEYIANGMTCDDEQRLAVSHGHKFVPRCQLDDPTLYDGCQCQLHDELCYCVDERGDMISGKATKILDDVTWQQTCVQILDCENTRVTV
eukprot:25568_1